MGKHDGLMYYTLGQRRGLGIGGQKEGSGESWYVAEKDLENNILFVTQGDGKELFSTGLVATELNWIPEKPKQAEFDCFAKFRYRQADEAVHVSIQGKKAKVEFAQKQRAVTPGQYVVFYDKDGYCLGGGVIDEVIKD